MCEGGGERGGWGGTLGVPGLPGGLEAGMGEGGGRRREVPPSVTAKGGGGGEGNSREAGGGGWEGEGGGGGGRGGGVSTSRDPWNDRGAIGACAASAARAHARVERWEKDDFGGRGAEA